MIAGYTDRQTIAIENPESADPKDALCTTNPFTRVIRRYQRDKSNTLQFVSILTVDPDSPCVWHARGGFLEPVGDHADRSVPLSTYTDEMSRMLRLELAELLKLPREFEVKGGTGPRGNRPTELHARVRLTQYEVTWMRGVQNGTIQRQKELRYPEREAV